MNALLHTFSALDVKDNPARVGTPSHVELDSTAKTFWDLPKSAQRLKVDAWLETKDDPDGWIHDQLSIIDTKRLMNHFIAGDDAEIGRMVAALLIDLGYTIEKERGL